MAGRGVRAKIGIVCLVGAWLAAVPAQAKDAYVFDPALSLTGSCAVSTQDLAPDPAEPPCGSEGAEAKDHPEAAFEEPRSEATDAYGNIYVPSSAGGKAVVDIFDSEGFFIAQVPEVALGGASFEDIAIDDEGHLYLYGFVSEPVVLRLDPDTGYDPANGKFAYKEPIAILTNAAGDGISLQGNSIAVDSHGHLYVAWKGFNSPIKEYGSAAEENKLIDSTIGEGILQRCMWITVDRQNGDIYAVSRPEGKPSEVKVFSGESGHELKRTIKGFSPDYLTVAVDETSGRVLVSDLEVRKKVYIFAPSEGDQTTSEAISTVEHAFKSPFPAPRITVDNGTESPNLGYLFVPSIALSPSEPDHLYAFEPIEPPGEPEVESVTASEITDTEAEIEAVINPGNATTEYTIQYVTQEAFDENEWEAAVTAAEGEIPAGGSDVPVSATISGLAPGTAYRVRVFADNCDPEEPLRPCTDEAEAAFRTYATPAPLPPCPNQTLRAGLSAHLPDCRAYELVSPSNTGGRPPFSSVSGLFATSTASPQGGSVSFLVGGGGIPGLGSAGGFNGDGYVAQRHPDGWQTERKGPTGVQSAHPHPGPFSPDHGFAAWATGPVDDFGTLVIEGSDQYILYPDGSSHLVGRGSLGADPRAALMKITMDAAHIIFTTSVQLEPQAPPTGARAIYDRTIDSLTGEEQTHVVSLLPGNLPQEEGQDAIYLGSSENGSAIAFKLSDASASPIYLRLGNNETIIATEEPGTEFAGFSSDGRFLFYVSGDDLYRYDTQVKATDQITASGDALFANVSADGSHVYFVSPSVLTGEEENSHGDKALSGEQNLYLWDGEGIEFVATVTDRDVNGELLASTIQIDGLGLWTLGATGGAVAVDPSRSSADGSVFLFKSRASLTDYDAGGNAEVYRFQATAGELACLSCSPTGSSATGDATLYSVGATSGGGPISANAWIPNLSTDGERAFFESPEPLVMRDTDKSRDVYEWEENGVGSCTVAGGCVYLISSGQSGRPNYLYGASESGDDVFFITSDLLTGADQDETPSIYDARVEGGFAEPEERICDESEVCKPAPTPPPLLRSSGTALWGSEKPPARKPCPKGKHRVKRHGKVRCVKRRKHKHHRRHRGGRG